MPVENPADEPAAHTPATDTTAAGGRPAGKRPANPLALAVLGLLLEQPLHPHAMAATLRERQLDLTFKLTTGSLYDTVRALARDGWIEEDGTERVGGRPARTVYRHTPEGRTRFTAWLDELIREPAREFPKFVSALSYLGALGPRRAAEALRERAAALEARVAADADAYRAAREEHRAPRLFVIEAEYARAMAEAELRWVRETADEIERGALPWPGEDTDA
ncbi:PadR family transcriptional regulator [Streptomyces sp. NPDC021100]|uniref:PadR family transcriptional regulator n=1 Tax=Streptomyces sp. NPDC021100 TaxID=3365114 RepID=UPI00379CAA9C